MDSFYRDYLIATGALKGDKLSGQSRNSLDANCDIWSGFPGIGRVLLWFVAIVFGAALLIFVLLYWMQILVGIVTLGVIMVIFSYPMAFLLAILIGSCWGDD